MRKFAKIFTVIYGIVIVFACGWLTPIVEFPRALFLALFFGSPCFVAWRRIFVSSRPVTRGEYFGLAFGTVLVFGCSTYLTMTLFHAGVDKKVKFEGESRIFCRQLQKKPGYDNVQVHYNHRKGGTVILNGSVSNKDLHEDLILMTQGLILCQEMGVDYYDGVDYPGKPSPKERH